MNEEIIKKYKTVYLEIETPTHLAERGFDDLKFRLTEQDKPGFNVYRYGFIFASLLVLITAGTVGASQNAKEGDFLYPVRAISEPIIMTVKQNIMQSQNKDEMIEAIPDEKPSSPTPNPENTDRKGENKNNGDENKKSVEEVKGNNKELKGNGSANEKKADEVKGASTQSEDKKSAEDKGAENKKPEDGNSRNNDNTNNHSFEKKNSGEDKNKNRNR